MAMHLTKLYKSPDNNNNDNCVTINDIWYYYRFIFEDNTEKKFLIRLDRKTLSIVSGTRMSYPSWTLLSNNKCLNCPLSEEQHSYCPVAVNLIDVVESFKYHRSIEEVSVEIETNNRIYHNNTSLQDGLCSLAGIYMSTSGCPILDKFRPLVKTHLPFAGLEETTYRTISTYLLAQYFVMKNGKNPDWELKNLVNLFDKVRVVNKCFKKRLEQLNIEDALLNAIVCLDIYIRFTNSVVVEDELADFKNLFLSYF